MAYRFLPISALPSVDIPTIVVIAARPGADPETMANSVAAPLERRLGEISGVTEITSTSSIGNTSVVVQFDIDRDINGAARDVQAAINAAITDLPSDLPNRPFYRKFNPADAPIMTLALSSDTLTTAQIYDAADTILAQRLAQAEGVSQVTVNGAEKPAVRVRLDPVRLAAAGLAGQDVLTAIKGTNVLQPTGSFQGPDRAETIGINGQISQASDYAPLVIKTGNGAVLRLSDVATVIDGVANTRLAAWNGKQPAILLTITKSAGANVIETVDRIKELLPQLMEWLPANIKLTVISDRTTTIRASVADVQYTMLITIALVLLVVLVFMRRLMPTIAAAVTVPLSICGTLAGMWFMGYLLDNFSLMALTISVGFVVDDAIVMIENIVRHRERGVDPMRAALIGSRQIGFTVMSISISLVAVFIPLIFMGGIMGRLFHEFAMTLTMAIAVSAVVSLTLTPMICGQYMRGDVRRSAARPDRRAARPGAGARLRRRAAILCGDARLGAGTPRVHAAGDARHHRADGAALHRAAEGFPAAAGHRHSDRFHPRLARRVVPGDGGSPARAWSMWCCATPRWPASARRWACRTAGARSIAAVSRQPEAAVGAWHLVRGGDRPVARTARKGGGRADHAVLGAGPARWRTAGRRAIPVRGRRPGRQCAAPLGAGAGRQAADHARHRRCDLATRIAPARRSTW